MEFQSMVSLFLSCKTYFSVLGFCFLFYHYDRKQSLIYYQDISNSESTKGKECRPQDAVVIDFVGRLAKTRDDENGPVFHEAKDWLIVVGDKWVCPALEMGVRFMNEGQSAIIWAHSKFAYGMSSRKYGDYELPPYSNVRYEITVKSIYCPEGESSDTDGFQIKLAIQKKVIANDMFANELYCDDHGVQQRAIRLYSKAADEMLHLIQNHAAEEEQQSENYDEEDGKEKTEQASEIMLDCLNNIVAVYTKCKMYHEAKDAAVKVLSHDPDNYKALLRAARAAMLDPAGTYEESDLAIAAAEKVVKHKGLDGKDIRKLRAELKEQKQKYKQRRQEMSERIQKGMRQKQPGTLETAISGSAVKPETVGQNVDKETSAEGVDTSEDTHWMRKLLPYVAQLFFPFILYYLIVWTSDRLKDQKGSPREGDQQHSSSMPGEL